VREEAGIETELLSGRTISIGISALIATSACGFTNRFPLYLLAYRGGAIENRDAEVVRSTLDDNQALTAGVQERKKAVVEGVKSIARFSEDYLAEGVFNLRFDGLAPLESYLVNFHRVFNIFGVTTSSRDNQISFSRETQKPFHPRRRKPSIIQSASRRVYRVQTGLRRRMKNEVSRAWRQQLNVREIPRRRFYLDNQSSNFLKSG